VQVWMTMTFVIILVVPDRVDWEWRRCSLVLRNVSIQ
jgi:hypothetical protein